MPRWYWDKLLFVSFHSPKNTKEKKEKKRMFASCIIVIYPPVWVWGLSFSFLSSWFSPNFLGWQVHRVNIFLRYSSKMSLKECRKKSIHPLQFFFYIYMYIYILLMEEITVHRNHIHPCCIFRRKKKSEKACLLSAFHSSSIPNFELFFICHEDQRPGMPEK